MITYTVWILVIAFTTGTTPSMPSEMFLHRAECERRVAYWERHAANDMWCEAHQITVRSTK